MEAVIVRADIQYAQKKNWSHAPHTHTHTHTEEFHSHVPLVLLTFNIHSPLNAHCELRESGAPIFAHCTQLPPLCISRIHLHHL
jgi:hypothetical protein